MSDIGLEPAFPKSTSWEPVLDGSLLERTHVAISDIARDLARVTSAPDVGRLPANLGGGSAGVALFHAYASADPSQDRAHARIAAELTEHAIATMREDPGLYAGYPGVAWVAAHLSNWILDADTDQDPFEDIDLETIDLLSQPVWRRHFDLISGLVGLGVYALERVPAEAADKILSAVIRQLEQLATPDGHGLTWFTTPHLLSTAERDLYKDDPASVRNLGVAHGVPGVIGFLGWVAGSQATARAEARTLLDGAVQWLLGQPQAHGENSFPNAIASGITRPARLAWCYGDPGIAAALLLASRSVGDEETARVAVSIGLRAAAKSADHFSVRDAGLCHGAAGLAHIFNRLFQATHEPQFADAARRWFERTLEMRQPDSGLGGFRFYGPSRSSQTPQDPMIWQDDPAFLTGAAGVGLALLAGVGTVEPAWDRTMLISVPLAPRHTANQ